MANTDDKNKVVADLFDQAMKNYDLALKTGLKLQEESTRLWASLWNQTAVPPEWQKKARSFSDELIPQTQKTVDEYLKLIEHNTRTSIELLRKAIAAGQATSPQDAQNKLLGVWENAITALRDSALAVTQANTHVVESLMGFARKTCEPVSTKA
jgi:hypothetical protein